MVSWSGSVAAVEAKKPEVAIMHALFTPRPSIWTGRLACSHCLSLSSTFSTNDYPRLSVSSKMSNNGMSKHGDVLKTYTSFGIAIEFSEGIKHRVLEGEQALVFFDPSHLSSSAIFRTLPCLVE